MHYICTAECGGVSDHEGTCQAEGCSKHGELLEPCNCEDGKHYGRQQKKEKEEKKDPGLQKS